MYFLRIISAFKQYRFLLSELVARDFKTKYKRSTFGVFWSFLNPLLTMFVQYAVFSHIFRSNIPNFPLYLFSGILIFSFFTEATSMGITAITGNASLITKVYIPKYIFPTARVISSLINLALTLIPLFFILVITKQPINWSVLLLPFPILCVFVFTLGFVFFLSALMVFFRDIQFLWGVISLMWMYLTPIFYPESIIPPNLSFVLKYNPLRHFIKFLRLVLLEGVFPPLISYVFCLTFAFGMLLIGLLVFKKTQDNFIHNL